MFPQNRVYSSLRPSRILQSEKAVANVMKVLSEEYINPFHPTLDQSKLFNLSSGIPLENTDVLECWELGEKKHKDLTEQRIIGNELSFHDPIKKTKLTLFSNASSTKIKKNCKVTSIEVNRNIIGKLLALSMKTGKNIDFEAALSFPLTQTPLSLANADGSRRTTQKSKLVEVLHSYTDDSEDQVDFTDADVFIVDFIAQVRVLTKEVPDTYEHLALKILHSIPKGYTRVHIVADTYREISIKTAERQKRGTSSKISIKSEKSKIPRDFSAFMMNGANKSRLIEIIFDYITKHRSKSLQIIRANRLLLSKDGDCTEITISSVTTNEVLCSNQEEADTKVILHILNATGQSANSRVLLRSPSADTDILVITLAMLPHPDRVYYDSGVGKHRSCIRLSDFDMPDAEKKTLIGFHAVTGNDYISAFFGKGKGKCWKMMKSREEFASAFKMIGSNWELTEDLMNTMETFVCKLYGSKKSRVNEARYELFHKKYAKQNKVVNLSLLPPCKSTLEKHLQRANYVARIWKCCGISNTDYPHPSQYGWNAVLEIEWVQRNFSE